MKTQSEQTKNDAWSNNAKKSEVRKYLRQLKRSIRNCQDAGNDEEAQNYIDEMEVFLSHKKKQDKN